VWSSQALTALLGVVAGGALFAAAPWLCGHVLRIPDALLAEATGSFRLLAVALPIIVTAAGLRGLLEAQQRFDVIAGVRLFLGVVTFVGPALMMPFTRNLVAMTLVLVVGRLLGWAALAAACWRVTPSLRRAPAMDRQAVGELVRFGGWMTVTNLVTPIMTYLDRFALAALVSLETVGHATTIFEAATRIAILPVALVGVLFPAFSTAGAMDASRRDELYRLGLLSLVAVLYPMILAIIAFGQEGLRVWVGADIALAAGPALKVLALGVFVNALGHVPFALVQGCGRADLTAKLHLLQLPPYVVAVWWLVSEYGLMGAVVAWSGRAAVDALGMFVLAVTAGNAAPPRRSTLLGAAVAAAGVAGVVVAPPGGFRVALFATAVILFTVVTWRVMLRPGERATFGALIDPVRRSRGDR
jgi:O-antigen/teichoic acid export membrane protein